MNCHQRYNSEMTRNIQFNASWPEIKEAKNKFEEFVYSIGLHLVICYTPVSIYLLFWLPETEK